MTTEKTNSNKPAAKQRAGKLSDADRTKLIRAADKKVPEMKKVFGKNLARIRKAAGHSQFTLSLSTGMTRNFINELEMGTKGASFLTLAKLSYILQTPAYEFFKSDEKDPPDEDGFYSDPIDRIADQLHEIIETWNGKRIEELGD
jgi:transcriptional regulator with XRE-family HTH domain